MNAVATKGSNPRTVEEAKAVVKAVEAMFSPWDHDAVMNGFTDDCKVRFGNYPEFQGKKALEEFWLARKERQIDYKPRKFLRSFCDDVISNYWEGTWQDSETGENMQGRGVEIWVMRNGKIAEWDAAFNIRPVLQAEGTSVIG